MQIIYDKYSHLFLNIPAISPQYTRDTPNIIPAISPQYFQVFPKRHKKRLSVVRKAMRFQADSNRCERFCRPVPNHSDMEPFALP